MKKLICLLLLMAFSADVSFAATVPVGWTSSQNTSADYSILGNTATISSDVYSYSSGEYVYAYQITNTSSVPLSFFSVAIYPGADVFGVDYDSSGLVVAPAGWWAAISGTQVDSVNAIFADTLENDGISSAILWFKSNYGPASGNAALIGASTIHYYASVPDSGQVLVPIPEPATIVLFSLAGFIGVKRNRRKA